MTIVGIDPGLKGGIAVIDEKTKKILHLFMMPLTELGKATFAISAMNKIFLILKKRSEEKEDDELTVFIEKAHSRPLDSKRGAFSNGFGYGILQSIMEINKIPYQIIGAKTWQKEILKDYDKTDTKLASIQYCQRKYPEQDFVMGKTKLAKKPKDGLTDSVCIALYGVTQNER